MMNYNGGFPVGYQPYGYYPSYPGYGPYQAPGPVQQQAQGAQEQQPTIQNGGFVSVRSFDEVANWPIAPGNSVTFLVEGNPLTVCTKTKGFSQLDQPVIEVFDLVKRAARQEPANTAPVAPDGGQAFATKEDIRAIRNDLDAVKTRVTEMAETVPPRAAGSARKKGED